MTVAPQAGRARRRRRLIGGLRPGPPPLRWWAPALTFAVAAVVLAAVVIAFGTNKGPLDDPNQAFQRDGALHNGPHLPNRVGDVVFGGSSVVVLFERRQPPDQTFAQWSAAVTRNGSRLVVALAGRPGASALRNTIRMRTPNDGGQPVGYAIVDRSRRVRFATLDPAYLDHVSEVVLLTAGLTGHGS